MKTFLILLAVAAVAAIELWNLGLASQIWPDHPLVGTGVLAAALAAAVQILLSSLPRASKNPSDTKS